MSRFGGSQSAGELRAALPSVHVAAQGGRAIKTMSHGTQVSQPHGPVCVFHDLLFPTLWQEVTTLPATPLLYASNASNGNLPFSSFFLCTTSSLPAFALPPPSPSLLIHVSPILLLLGTFSSSCWPFLWVFTFLLDMGTRCSNFTTVRDPHSCPSRLPQISRLCSRVLVFVSLFFSLIVIYSSSMLSFIIIVVINMTSLQGRCKM